MAESTVPKLRVTIPLSRGYTITIMIGLLQFFFGVSFGLSSRASGFLPSAFDHVGPAQTRSHVSGHSYIVITLRRRDLVT